MQPEVRWIPVAFLVVSDTELFYFVQSGTVVPHHTISYIQPSRCGFTSC